MKQSNREHVQYVMACLLMHSKYVKQAEPWVVDVLSQFNLSSCDKELLGEYLVKNANKIWLSAHLLEEKRWREMLVTIKYTKICVGEKHLKDYWADYLDINNLRDMIPATPVEESIKFLTYLRSCKPDRLVSNVCLYELLRNKASLYSFGSEIKPVKPGPIYRIELNPSVEFGNFDVSVPELIKSRFDLGRIGQSMKREKICFYKDVFSGRVKCIQLNDKSYRLLIEIKNNTAKYNFFSSTGLVSPLAGMMVFVGNDGAKYVL
jgi:hypothetical protein